MLKTFFPKWNLKAILFDHPGGGTLKPKGSITIFISLLLTVIIAFISANILSVKIQAGRAQAVNSADQALFSLFALYDKDLLDEYDVFFLDAGLGSSGFNPSGLADFITDTASYILNPDKGSIVSPGKTLLKLTDEKTSIKAYTTASGHNGDIFCEQAVQYMKNTVMLRGAASLMGPEDNNFLSLPSYEAEGEKQNELDFNTAYESVSKAAEEKAAESAEKNDSLSTEPIQNNGTPSAVPDSYFKIIPSVISLKGRSLTELCVPNPALISGSVFSASSFFSSGSRNTGAGVTKLTEDLSGAGSRLLLSEYIQTHCGSFLSPKQDSKIKYQTEYIIVGKNSDRENLDAVIKRIFLIRMGINALAINTSPALKSEVAAVSTAISAALMIPELQEVLTVLLTAGWAWCESLVDMRSLLKGNSAAILKSAENWQVSLEKIPELLNGSSSFEKPCGKGMKYSDYLCALLLQKDRIKTQDALLKVVEDTIQNGHKRTSFRLDNCIDTLEIDFSVKSEDLITFTANRRYSYRENT